MFQASLIWLSGLIVCLLPQRTLLDPNCLQTRGIALGGLDGLLKNNLAVPPSATSPFDFFKTSSVNDYVGEYNGWPLVDVKFDHPIQSPIDLITSTAVTLNLPVLDIVEPLHRDIKAKVYNSGHTCYVYMKRDPSLRPYLVGGPLKDKFIFEQMHFHWGSQDIWGSEHFINGDSFAVEIHLVHYNSKYGSFSKAASMPDGLAVLTVFAEGKEEDNPLLNPLYNLLPVIATANSSRELNSIEAMQWAVSGLRQNSEYYAYPGSLTTKPYSENVVFILLPKPITLSHKQLSAFRGLHGEHEGKILENRREVQPLHDRPIIRSTAVAR